MDRFFYDSDLLCYLVLRPLSHITGSWELDWDKANSRYEEEPESFGGLLNSVLTQLDATEIPASYHQQEDSLAKHVLDKLNWGISKVGQRWLGADYASILEQGGFGDLDQQNLIIAAKGRMNAARNYGQNHFDNMEQGHRQVLSHLLTVILFHRADLSSFS